MAHSLARMLPGYMIDVAGDTVSIRYLRRRNLAHEFSWGRVESRMDFQKFLTRAKNLGIKQIIAYSLDRVEPEMAPVLPTPLSYTGGALPLTDHPTWDAL
jgi:hypothetical protein